MGKWFNILTMAHFYHNSFINISVLHVRKEPVFRQQEENERKSSSLRQCKESKSGVDDLLKIHCEVRHTKLRDRCKSYLQTLSRKHAFI